MAPAQPFWPPVHPFSRALHAIAVAIGAAVAVVGLVRSAWLAGVEPDHSTTTRAVTCAALLVVAVAYSFTGLRRWSTWRAIPFFLWSYILVGVTVDYHVHDLVKDFAPDDPTTTDYVTAYGKIGGALAVALLLAFNALRAARARTLRQTPELAEPSRGA